MTKNLSDHESPIDERLTRGQPGSCPVYSEHFFNIIFKRGHWIP